MSEQTTSHDMSIHVYEVGDTMTGEEFGAYMKEWGCSAMRPIRKAVKDRKGKTKWVDNPELTTFILMKEVNGYSETWEVTGHLNLAITQMTRMR